MGYSLGIIVGLVLYVAWTISRTTGILSLLLILSVYEYWPLGFTWFKEIFVALLLIEKFKNGWVNRSVLNLVLLLVLVQSLNFAFKPERWFDLVYGLRGYILFVPLAIRTGSGDVPNIGLVARIMTIWLLLGIVINAPVAVEYNGGNSTAYRHAGWFKNPNELAVTLLICMYLLSKQYYSDTNKVLLVLLSLGILVTASRAGALSLLLFWFLRNVRFASLFLLISLLFTGGLILNSRIFSETVRELSMTSESSYRIWALVKGFEYFVESPKSFLIGHGSGIIGGGEYSVSDYIGKMGQSKTLLSENQLLKVLLEFGILGLIVLRKFLSFLPIKGVVLFLPFLLTGNYFDFIIVKVLLWLVLGIYLGRSKEEAERRYT